MDYEGFFVGEKSSTVDIYFADPDRDQYHIWTLT